MQELEIPHQPYSHEQRKLASITEGNLQKLRKCQQERFEGQLGKVADEPLRHEKNMSIIVLTLASRAAIQGGLSPELAKILTREVSKNDFYYSNQSKTNQRKKKSYDLWALY